MGYNNLFRHISINNGVLDKSAFESREKKEKNKNYTNMIFDNIAGSENKNVCTKFE